MFSPWSQVKMVINFRVWELHVHVLVNASADTRKYNNCFFPPQINIVWIQWIWLNRFNTNSIKLCITKVPLFEFDMKLNELRYCLNSTTKLDWNFDQVWIGTRTRPGSSNSILNSTIQSSGSMFHINPMDLRSFKLESFSMNI